MYPMKLIQLFAKDQLMKIYEIRDDSWVQHIRAPVTADKRPQDFQCLNCGEEVEGRDNMEQHGWGCASEFFVAICGEWEYHRTCFDNDSLTA